MTQVNQVVLNVLKPDRPSVLEFARVWPPVRGELLPAVAKFFRGRNRFGV